LGLHLTEQSSITVTADLDGVDNFQGSTSITGHGYLHYDGEHRRERGAALIETMNIPTLRHEKGRWRQRMQLKFIFENLLETGNRVVPGNSMKPRTTWSGDSFYAKRSMKIIRELAERFLEPLPVEHLQVPGRPNQTESHILCTTIMGETPSDSIVDSALVHHQIRNLLVLGGSVFPTASPANPTLTLSALSLRAADLFFT
ncbi:MAG: GMC family oxidoreductase, partial [Opitutae bacterium]|nr:GMC family oxidoreductase [Opitutae bacterium]